LVAGRAGATRWAKLRRIGHLIGGTQAGTSRVSVGLIEGLRDLGYVEGRDYIVEYRYAEGHYDRFPVLAAELVRLNVDVVVLGAPSAISERNTDCHGCRERSGR